MIYALQVTRIRSGYRDHSYVKCVPLIQVSDVRTFGIEHPSMILSALELFFRMRYVCLRQLYRVLDVFESPQIGDVGLIFPENDAIADSFRRFRRSLVAFVRLLVLVCVFRA